MAKIFVTGGNGFIGSHLVDGLIKLNHEVTCFIRDKSNLHWLDNIKHNDNLIFRKDLNHLDGYDRIYHIAGVLGAKKIPLLDYSKAHVELTYELLSRMKKGQHFIYMSSAWVNLIDKPYELTKYDGEYLVKLSKIDYTIVRPGFVYGERDMHLLNIFRMIKWLKVATPVIGTGMNQICPTYVKDVVDHIIDPKSGVIGIAGKPITVRQFMYFIADLLKVSRSKLTLPYIPPPLRDLLKWDFFTKERVFKSDVETTPIMLGLTNTIKWYKENHYL